MPMITPRDTSTMIGVRQFDARMSRCFSASERVAASSTRRADEPLVRRVDQSLDPCPSRGIVTSLPQGAPQEHSRGLRIGCAPGGDRDLTHRQGPGATDRAVITLRA